MVDGHPSLTLLKVTCLALLLGVLITAFPGSAAAHGDLRHDTANVSSMADNDGTLVVVDECCHLDGLCIGKILPGSQAQTPIGQFGTILSVRLGRQVLESLPPAAEPPPPRL